MSFLILVICVIKQQVVSPQKIEECTVHKHPSVSENWWTGEKMQRSHMSVKLWYWHHFYFCLSLFMLHSHTYSFSYAVILFSCTFQSYLCCIDEARNVGGAGFSVTSVWFHVHWHSDIQVLGSNMTADEQFCLQKTYTLQAYFFLSFSFLSYSKTRPYAKYELICWPLKWLFFNMCHP